VDVRGDPSPKRAKSLLIFCHTLPAENSEQIKTIRFIEPEMRLFAIFNMPLMPYAFWGRLLFVVLCSVFGGADLLHGAEVRAPKVAVVVSRDIRPYIEAVEGMSMVLAESASAKVQVFPLEKFKGKSRDVLIQSLTGEKFDLFVAVGPEAVRLVSEESLLEKTPWLYSMVLNPPKISGRSDAACGVPLDVPPQKQLEVIAEGLTAVKRLGLLYDPRYNSEFFLKASTEAPSLNLKIVPLKVSSKKDIPVVLKQQWESVDALWLIPDQTVISESIVQYIIKDALFRKTPVIGYNRFFYESGAAVAFVFDYEELGRQTGRLAADVLMGKACEKEPPVFHVWLNLRVIDKLGLDVSEKKIPPIEAGP
jgi:putative tryptophan/tyrosine transport system substrate-binding protein